VEATLAVFFCYNFNPNPAKEFRPQRSVCLVAVSAPRYHSASEHGSCLTVFRRSINASPRCRPLRLLASLRWLHIVFVPSAAQAKAAAIRRYGRSMGVFPNANEAPLSLLKKPTLRALTTTFRSDGQTIAGLMDICKAIF